MTEEDLIRRGSVVERLDLAEHDAEERDWRSGANELARIRKYVTALPAVQPAPVAEVTAERDALRSELNALRVEAEKAFGADDAIAEAWDAFGTRGNPKVLTLAEQISSISRELDAALDARPVAEVQAEAVAGAYEAAAAALPAITSSSFDGVDEQIDGPYVSRAAILALTPADAAAALDRIRAEAREKALREAEKALRDWQDSLTLHSAPETALTVGMAADVILALIKEPAHD